MQKCSVEECPNISLPELHGFCLDHYNQTIHPSSGIRHGRVVTMAGKLFNSLIFGAEMTHDSDQVKRVLPVITVPFIHEEFPDFVFKGPRNVNVIAVETGNLQLREEFIKGIHERNPLEKPIIFLVTTNIPHTSIYILYRGQLYSVGYGYEEDSLGKKTNALYSIDIPLTTESEARIVWIGLLTNTIRLRLQHEFDQVTEVAFNTKQDLKIRNKTLVDSLMFFRTSKKYGGLEADTSATEWNCSKWAMNVLFGEKKPKNFRNLVSKTNPGLTEDQLTLFLEAYRHNDQDKFISVLNQINNPIFPKGGRRKRMTNKNGMKKPIKMRRTTRKPQ